MKQRSSGSTGIEFKYTVGEKYAKFLNREEIIEKMEAKFPFLEGHRDEEGDMIFDYDLPNCSGGVLFYAVLPHPQQWRGKPFMLSKVQFRAHIKRYGV